MAKAIDISLEITQGQQHIQVETSDRLLSMH